MQAYISIRIILKPVITHAKIGPMTILHQLTKIVLIRSDLGMFGLGFRSGELSLASHVIEMRRERRRTLSITEDEFIAACDRLEVTCN